MKKKNFSYFLFFLLCATSIFSSCKEKAKDENNLTTCKVRIMTVGHASDENRKEYVGTVESQNSVDVSFLSAGTVESLNFSEGQKVAKGQLMATLNTVTLKSAHNATLATLKQAQDACNRLEKMYESQSLPEIKLIDAKTKLEEAKSAEIMTRKSLSDSYLYAPQSGVISKKYGEKGMNVSAGTPVYTIIDIRNVNIGIPVPEGEISKFRIGQMCSVNVSALNNQNFTGQIVEKGVTANPLSHTYSVKVKIDNLQNRLMPGMVVKAYFADNADNLDNRILIPIKYVQLDYPNQRFVWVVSKDNKAVRKNVTLGNLLGNDVEVIEGLTSGERIITDGYQNISPDSKVSIVNE